jgi:mono/diheme cytochrome c family protein
VNTQQNAVGLLALLLVGGAQAADEERIERGRYLLHAGGCITCHTVDNAEPEDFLAGGRALETPFGTFYSPNITPDPDTGIGHWTDAEFIAAFRHGRAPDGKRYYPAFPYSAYTGITDSDLLDLKAYLFSLEPVDHPTPQHELSWFAFRVGMIFWNWLNFEPEVFQPDPQQSEQWNRGAYLVRHLGHCGECHTPRTWTGGLDRDDYLAGNLQGPGGDRVPNITPDRDTGIGRWSESDIEFFLDIGMLPDGDFTGGSMGPVISDSTSHLTTEDRRAIAVYLRSLEPLPSVVD